MKKLIEQFKANWVFAAMVLCLAYYVVSTSINDYYLAMQFLRLNKNLEEFGLAILASQRRVEQDTRQWRKEAQDNIMLSRYNFNLAESLSFRAELFYDKAIAKHKRH